MPSDPLTSANAPIVTPRCWAAKRKTDNPETTGPVKIRAATSKHPTGKRIRLPVPPPSPHLEPKPDHNVLSDDEDEDDEVYEDATYSASSVNHELIVMKLLALLRPEIHRMTKRQNKQRRAINSRLDKIEEDLSAVFSISSHIAYRIGAEDGSTTANVPPHSPSSFPPHLTERSGEQPPYADVVRVAEQGTQAASDRRNATSTSPGWKGPTNVLEYKETLQTALHRIDNSAATMKPQET